MQRIEESRRYSAKWGWVILIIEYDIINKSSWWSCCLTLRTSTTCCCCICLSRRGVWTCLLFDGSEIFFRSYLFCSFTIKTRTEPSSLRDSGCLNSCCSLTVISCLCSLSSISCLGFRSWKVSPFTSFSFSTSFYDCCIRCLWDSTSQSAKCVLFFCPWANLNWEMGRRWLPWARASSCCQQEYQTHITRTHMFFFPEFLSEYQALQVRRWCKFWLWLLWYRQIAE